MSRRISGSAFRLVVVGGGLAALAACGGKMKLDEEAVDAQIDRITTSLPVCTSGAEAPAAARAAAIELGRLAVLARDLPSLAQQADGRGPALNVAGPCGGELQVGREHENGVTDIVGTFASYCADSAAGQVFLNGTFVAKERGNPSDSGPVIHSLEASTDGAIEVTTGGTTLSLTVDDARVDYGVPAAWTPGIPTEDDPDVVRLGEATVTYADGAVGYVRDIRIERVGNAPAIVRILDGEAGVEGEGHVDVSTPDDDPLEVNLAGVAIEGGTVVLSGRGGTEVTLTPGATDGAWDVALDGAAYDAVDCSAGRAPLVQIGLALLAELPVH
jgi:hypothetical protein